MGTGANPPASGEGSNTGLLPASFKALLRYGQLFNFTLAHCRQIPNLVQLGNSARYTLLYGLIWPMLHAHTLITPHTFLCALGSATYYHVHITIRGNELN